MARTAANNEDTVIIHDMEPHAFELRKIAEYPIRVSGKGGEPMTHLFKMNVGMDFIVGAGFRAILRRSDGKMFH